MRSRRAVLRGGAAAGTALMASWGFDAVAKIAPPPITGLGFIAVSADGRLIAVEYDGRIALYDWRTGQIVRVPSPERLHAPSFSPDGRTLAAVRGAASAGHIVLIDARTFDMTPVANSTQDFEKFSLRFQPGSRRVAYAAGRIAAPAAIVLQDVGEQTSRELLDRTVGFHDVSDLCFMAPNELVFQARGPRHPALAQQVAALGRRSTDRVQYRLRIEDGPGFAIPTPLEPQLDTRTGIPFGDGVSSLCAARNGSALAWTGISQTKPHQGGSAVGKGPINYEAFEQRDGRITQLTERQTYTFACAISDDGGTIAFTEDPDRGMEFDLTILDRRNNTATPTGLLRKLRAG
jgi:dipeptidyl aminopeptidase/acylaminoacyl peptidase